MISLAPVVLPICFLVFGLAYYRRVFLIREANVNHYFAADALFVSRFHIEFFCGAAICI